MRGCLSGSRHVAEISSHSRCCALARHCSSPKVHAQAHATYPARSYARALPPVLPGPPCLPATGGQWSAASGWRAMRCWIKIRVQRSSSHSSGTRRPPLPPPLPPPQPRRCLLAAAGNQWCRSRAAVVGLLQQPAHDAGCCWLASGGASARRPARRRSRGRGACRRAESIF